MAGGFTIEEKKISQFRDILIKNFEKSQANISKDINLYLDAVIAPSALNEEFYEQINKLSPFGSGNSEPIDSIPNRLRASSASFLIPKLRRLLFNCGPIKNSAER